MSDMTHTDDELVRFLAACHWIYPNLNDTFDYACADTEKIALDDPDEEEGEEEGSANTATLVKMWREFGHAGIRAYVGKMRGRDPLRELCTPEYEQAKAALDGWAYEPD